MKTDRKVKIDGRQCSQVVVISTTGLLERKAEGEAAGLSSVKDGTSTFFKEACQHWAGEQSCRGRGGVEGEAKRTSQQPATKGPLAGGDNGQLGLGRWN